MHDDAVATYPPLNTLTRVADNVWIVDGPVIRFGLPWPQFPFPTRMTVIRLASGDLFVHSPTLLTPSLRSEIAREGSVRYVIGPNRIHYWWIPDWKAAFPDADVYLAPRVAAARRPAARPAAEFHLAAQARIARGGGNDDRLEARAHHPGARPLARDQRRC